MKIKSFSKKQLEVLCWWCKSSKYSDYEALICDGAVRSGKTMCMGLSFISWAFYRFNDSSFALCGKTIRSLKRNVITPILSLLKELGFSYTEKSSENLIVIKKDNIINRFYLFGGKDEGSAALIQGMTLSGVLFDEVALMPRSFVEQALARCSVSGSKFWFNCNPEYPLHWFRQEWILKAKEKKALYLHFKMDDNPSLSKEILERYKSLYSGTFYQRFVEGKWTASEGIVYPFMDNPNMFYDLPDGNAQKWAVSCDYGTVNPASFGLWGLFDNVWYRVDEYYFNSRKEGYQKTDTEHYESLCQLISDRRISCITVDPSAASFIEVIKRNGKYNVIPAKNNVTDGIRKTAAALKQGKIKICKCCKDSIKEFGLYRWDETGKDTPVKENDHAMDDIRYFVTSIMINEEDFFVATLERR